jgi:hypothetical protein
MQNKGEMGRLGDGRGRRCIESLDGTPSGKKFFERFGFT